MAIVTLGATDVLVVIGDAKRKVVTITNNDTTNAALLRAFSRNQNTTTSTNFSYFLGPSQTFIARVDYEGSELTHSTYYALANAGTPILTVETSNF